MNHTDPLKVAIEAALELVAQTIELFDDKTMENDYMLDAGECAGIVRALKCFPFAALTASPSDSQPVADEREAFEQWFIRRRIPNIYWTWAQLAWQARAALQAKQEPVAWYDPSNKSPSQSVTFNRHNAERWPHLYPVALFAAPVQQYPDPNCDSGCYYACTEAGTVHPPKCVAEAQQGLSDERIRELWGKAFEEWGNAVGGPPEYVIFARAIESDILNGSGYTDNEVKQLAYAWLANGWNSVNDQLPEPGKYVLLMSEGWTRPAVMIYQEKPFQRFMDQENGRWYWYPERMYWMAVQWPIPSAAAPGNAEGVDE